jgi:hypothetical protein
VEEALYGKNTGFLERVFMHCERHTAQFKKNVYRDIKKLSKILLCG